MIDDRHRMLALGLAAGAQVAQADAVSNVLSDAVWERLKLDGLVRFVPSVGFLITDAGREWVRKRLDP